MKKVFFTLLLVVLFSCTKKESEITGVWSVNSKFYRATVKIIKEKGVLKGLVLYYNDDTMMYRYEEGESKNYFFENIKSYKDHYVDAISGETKTKEHGNAVTLELVAEDTLAVTSFIMDKPLREIWIKNKE